MSEKTNEELANSVIQARNRGRYDMTGSADERLWHSLTEAAARLRQQSEDSARLDWLNRVDACIDQIEGELQIEVVNHGYFYGPDIRAVIDKARKA